MIEKIKKNLEDIKELKDKFTYLEEQLDKIKDDELKKEIEKLIASLKESLETKIEQIPVRRDIIPDSVEVEIEEPLVSTLSEPLEVEVSASTETTSSYSLSYGLSTFDYSRGFDYHEVLSESFNGFRDRFIEELKEEGLLPSDSPITSDMRETIADKLKGVFPGKSFDEHMRMADNIIYGKKDKRPGDYLNNKTRW